MPPTQPPSSSHPRPAPPRPTPAPCAGEFFNHCCNPNAWWKDDFHLVARRPIAAGEEISYDYCTEDIDVAQFNCGAWGG